MISNIPKLDLLVVDVDNTFVEHLTVLSAYKVFFLNLLRFRLWNALRLFIIGMRLYWLFAFKRLHNMFFNVISSERMIKIWAKAIVKLRIKKEDYRISEKTIEKKLKTNVVELYKDLKNKNPRMKTTAVTQSFSFSNRIMKMLGFDAYYSNRFLTKKGVIKGYKLNVKNSKDKRKIAEKAVKKYKAKKIGVFVDDYDDAELLKLKNLRFVLYKKRLKRFIKPNSKLHIITFRQVIKWE